MPLDSKGRKVLYKPWKNTGSGTKKYWVYVKNPKNGNPKKIGFGHKGYQDYTQHKDEKRRKSYLARAKGIKKKDGTLAWKDKNSPNYWAVKFLWKG